MKKIMSLLLAVIMIFSIPCTAFAAESSAEGLMVWQPWSGFAFSLIRTIKTPCFFSVVRKQIVSKVSYGKAMVFYFSTKD